MTPSFLLRNRQYFGDPVSSGGDFQIRDFPLKRHHQTWDKIPETLFFQSNRSIPVTPSSYTLPPFLSRSDTPTKEDHANLISEFFSSAIEKVVLARVSTFTFQDRIDPLGVYSQLIKMEKKGTPFGVLFSKDVAFMGVTPELLFTKAGKVLKTMALAGTRIHSEEDALLTSEKDLREFFIVQEEISKKLSQIAHPFSVQQKPTLLRTHFLSHLHSPFEVELKEEMEEEKLLSFIHPTPAISGRPSDKALDYLFSHEPFDRGWYCGTFSFLSKCISEVYVCLRATLIIENKMHIFSGGGIVLGSKPENEWQELESKMNLFGVLTNERVFY